MSGLHGWTFQVAREVSDNVALVGTCTVRKARRVNIVEAPVNFRVSRQTCFPMLKLHGLSGKFMIMGIGPIARRYRCKAGRPDQHEPVMPAWAAWAASLAEPTDLNRDFNLGEVEAL